MVSAGILASGSLGLMTAGERPTRVGTASLDGPHRSPLLT